MVCPLCTYSSARPSWIGSTCYGGRVFPYVQCLSCASLYCDPMPDDEVLAQMYGPEYETRFAADPAEDDPHVSLPIVEWLKRARTGTFIDYGCGSGGLLMAAARLNWHPIGVELDDAVAQAVETRTGVRVLSRSQADVFDGPRADILHVGDVIEHLTALDQQMPHILRLIKPGGLLLAQGPLEGNPHAFALAVRAARSLRRVRRTEMAPYHVLLATAKAQRLLFQRFGLEELEYSVREVAWPAASRLTLSDLGNARTVGLFMLRRCSQVISAMRPNQWGNRYFYVGRWKG